MNSSLSKHLIEMSKATKKPIITCCETLKRRLDKHFPEVSAAVELYLNKKNHDKDNFSFSDLVNKWVEENIDHQKTAKFKCYKYSDIIEEAKEIVENFKQTKKKLVLVTKNTALKTTVNAILGSQTNHDFLSEKELWIQSGESMFLLNKIAKISHCCNHQWIHDSMKSSLFYKNHVIRNQIINKFNHSRLDQKKKYPFHDLSNLHYEFVNSISKNPLRKLFETTDHNISVTIYEYVRILREHLELKTKEMMSSVQHEIEVADPVEIPFIKEGLWLAGISCNDPINPLLLSTHKNIVGSSFSSFSNGQNVYPQSNIISEIIDKTKEYSVNTYEYSDPKPTLENRKNSFAINHITKLLNNPHNFYVENILKLKPYNFHPNHIIGIMIHSIFEELIKNICELKDFDKFNERMNSLLKQNYFSKVDFVGIIQKVQVMIEHLWTTIKDADTVYAEHEGMQTIVHNNQSYFLHGRADLLYGKDGKWGIIDFKTGSPPSWINIMNGSAPQISIGMLMLRFGGFLGKEIEHLADSGFISPKGLFVVSANSSVIQSAIEGIKSVIIKFWEEESPYHIHINDPGWPYRSIARSARK